MLSLNVSCFPGKGLLKAQQRASRTGELDNPGAIPISAPELHANHVPTGYSASIVEFFVPLFLLMFISVGSFIWLVSPQVNWAFERPLMLAISIALLWF